MDRAVCTKSKPFMVNFFKCGLYDYLIDLACFEQHNPSPNRGEELFGDSDPLERKVSNQFYFRLREAIRDWDSKFGVDKNGKITKFRDGYLKAFDPRLSSRTNPLIKLKPWVTHKWKTKKSCTI